MFWVSDWYMFHSLGWFYIIVGASQDIGLRLIVTFVNIFFKVFLLIISILCGLWTDLTCFFFFFACFRIRGTALPFSYFQLMFILVPLSSHHDVFAGVFSISCASCGVGLVNTRHQNLHWTRPGPTVTLGDAESNGETLGLVGTTLVL